MPLTLRTFDEKDYPAFVALYNFCRPDAPVSEEEIRHFDRANKGDLLVNLLVEEDAELIGALWALKDQTEACQVRLDLLVRPDASIEPLGGSLYRDASERLSPYAPSALVVRVREDWPEWLEFDGSRDFTEPERMWESRLEV